MMQPVHIDLCAGIKKKKKLSHATIYNYGNDEDVLGSTNDWLKFSLNPRICVRWRSMAIRKEWTEKGNAFLHGIIRATSRSKTPTQVRKANRTLALLHMLTQK